MKTVLFLILFTILFYAGCDKDSSDKKNDSKSDTSITKKSDDTKKTVLNPDIAGNYISDGYDKRKEGYDWVSVTVKPSGENEISIMVRSRADKKKPTCTFDTKAQKINDTTYSTMADGKKILITFIKSAVTIQPEKKEDEGALAFYCSGGATVAGTYTKISEALDQEQIDKTLFSKILNLQDIGFNVTAKPKDGKVEVEIYPFGLKLDKQTITQVIDGNVIDAEVEDLDADGSPEVVIYTQSGSDKKGNVIACSVLKKNSMILCYFPPVEENDKIKTGYKGNDKFTLIERNLAQQFPVFVDGKDSGKKRQVSYTLEKGENTKVFKVKDVKDF